MSGSNLPRTYDAKGAEARFYTWWEESGFFQGDPAGDGEPYSIVIPPPNVTGSLHMGHALNNAIQDFLIRYKRMDGYNAVWIPGTDHAGIATQWVVERQLREQGLDRREMGREAFLERVWAWKEESGSVITHQLRSLGVSCDWSRERFTMDEGLSSAVRHVFVKLYESGLIYRGTRMINWDPVGQTVLSDLEVEHEENHQGEMWSFAYPLADGDGEIVVATTRPETMLGDTAVAVHPDDPRYVALVGKMVRHPLLDREFPIVADAELVDPEFGTGAVKVTPAHDPNDFGVGKRHDLPFLTVLDDQARVNELGGRFAGLDRYEARTAVKEAMAELGLDRGTEPHLMSVGRSQRSGAIVEPMISTQWFVKMQPLAEPAIEAVEKGEAKFIPERWENTYFAWMRNIQDWCISRQLWWGHRIPAWYDEEGNVYVGAREDEVRSKYQLAENLLLRQDVDVLDTWFSAGLWTFSTLGWPDDREYFDRFHPTDVLVTGFDIIFFWVARMIMMTLKFTGEIPFKKVYITGLVRDEHGQKMSKSRGNILDPIDLIDGISLQELITKRTADMMQPQLQEMIEQHTRESFPDGITGYGTDALRFTFYSLASTGRDIKFDLGRTEGFRNFCNKIWNAARYVLMNSEDKVIPSKLNPLQCSVADRWIISRFEQTANAIEAAMANYRFDLASQALHEFIWNEYCDWYVELSKPILWDEEANPDQSQATRRVLLTVLEKSLRLLHPFMPFLTEEVWQRVAPLLSIEGDSIMLQPYPVYDVANVDQEAEANIDWLKGVIIAIRNIRGEMNISPARSIPVLLRSSSESDRQRLEGYRPYLQKLARLDSIEYLASSAEAPAAATQLHGDLEILVPLAGLIDVEAECARLNKEISKLEGGLKAVSGKLGNTKFVDNAPQAVVAREREKEQQMSGALKALREKLEQLQVL